MSIDIKSALKEAREAIKIKDFKTAALKCQVYMLERMVKKTYVLHIFYIFSTF